MLPIWVLPYLLGLCLGQAGQSAPQPQTEPSERQEAVQLSEILILTPLPYDASQVAAAEGKAKDLREAIQRGASFSDLAKTSSEGPTASFGGNMGVFVRGELDPSIEKAVFQLKAGEVSDVIRAKQGFLIFQVTRRSELDAHVELPPESSQRPASPALQKYVDQAKEKINRIWYSQMPPSALPPERKAGIVKVSFEISSDGYIRKLTILSSSGDPVLDQTALRAIRQAEPFPPLTDVTQQDHITVRTRFEYNLQQSPKTQN
jgi:TonB family protein